MTELLELELAEHPATLSTKEVKDPGLYPGYIYFHANTIARWLELIPGKVNLLQSAYLQRKTGWVEDRDYSALRSARMVFLDSGAISPLIAAAKGKGPISAVFEWMEAQDQVVAGAWRLHEAGVERAVVAMLDLPQYAALLGPIKLEHAMELTIRNAERFAKAWYDGKLPGRYKPVFTVQGVTAEDYGACAREYDRLGILGIVRDGEGWLAVGGTRDSTDAALMSIYREVRTVLGQGHVHAFGIGRQPQIVELTRRGYIDGSDSSATTQEVMFNRGPYQLKHDDMAKPIFVSHALWAAAALHYDATLAAALERGRGLPVLEQGTLL